MLCLFYVNIIKDEFLIGNSCETVLSSVLNPVVFSSLFQVLCFGLGLPLTEHETINNCVKVYVEWLSALLSPKPCVPQPILEDPNPFAQIMLHHLLNLFTPRPDSSKIVNACNSKWPMIFYFSHTLFDVTLSSCRAVHHFNILNKNLAKSKSLY